MRRSAPLLAALASGAAGVGYWLAFVETSKQPAELSAPAPASTAFTSAPAGVATPSPTPAGDPRQIALAIERALVAVDPAMRETAFNVLLPELLRLEPRRATALLERNPGLDSRMELREQLARQWILQDREAARSWMRTLGDEDRRAAAMAAGRVLAARSPAQALQLFGEFGVGADDGSRDHLIRRWAAEDPDAARRWLAAHGR